MCLIQQFTENIHACNTKGITKENERDALQIILVWHFTGKCSKWGTCIDYEKSTRCFGTHVRLTLYQGTIFLNLVLSVPTCHVSLEFLLNGQVYIYEQMCYALESWYKDILLSIALWSLVW